MSDQPNWGDQPNWSDEPNWGDQPNWGDDAPVEEEDVEYSTARQSVVSFFEGGLSIGTEADAFFRSIGSDMTYDEALKETQKRQAAFREENPELAATTEWAGIGASFFVPGGALAQGGKLLAKASTATRVGAGAAGGAATGALYQYGAEDVETGERSYGAGLAIGAITGGIATKVFTKSADEIQRMNDEIANRGGSGTHIWGDEGFVDSGVVATERGKPTKVREVETSAQARERGATLGPDNKRDSALAGSGRRIPGEKYSDEIMLGTREWVEKHAGPRAARLVSITEARIKDMGGVINQMGQEHGVKAYKFFVDNPEAYDDFVNIGQKGRMSVDEAVEKYPETAGIVDMFREAQKNEFPAWASLSDDLHDYMPRRGKGEMKDGMPANFDDYNNPAINIQRYTEEVMGARTIAEVFFKERADDIIADLKPAFKGQGRMEAMLDRVYKEAVEQGGKGSEGAARNMVEALRTTLIHSKQGGDAVTSTLRKWSSAGLLSNWSNALLNAPEGAVQAVYQNGVGTMMKTLVGAVPAAVNVIARQTPGIKRDILPNDWVTNQQIGLDDQWLGEVTDEATTAARRFGDGILKTAYTLSGVRGVNTLNQEIIGNSAVKKGKKLAQKAIEADDYTKLANHPAARGMTQDEVKQAALALSKGSPADPWVREWYATSLGLMQPVYSSSMPRFFNDFPGGRLLFGMMSFMSRQHNIIRSDIYGNMKDAVKYGFNSDKGAQALKDSLINSGKYVTLMGYFNGMWDDMRKDVMDAYDRDSMEEYLTGDFDIRGYEMSDANDAMMFLNDSALYQILSNASGGWYDHRSQEYGGKSFAPTGAPAIKMAEDGINAGISALRGDVTPAVRAAQTYVPGPSHIDKATRMLTGDRLVDYATDTGLDASGLMQALTGE